MSNFRTERYSVANRVRWEQFLTMGIQLAGKTILEPGAGIGDQTEWLLAQGVKSIIVNDGRAENLGIIQKRFEQDPRIQFVLGDLETCLDKPEFKFNVDFIFFYGVYYHMHETLDFRIMRSLATKGQAIAFDYLEGNDNTDYYGYDNPSTAVGQYSLRPTQQTLVKGLKQIWPYVYLPKTQLAWADTATQYTRHIAAASHTLLDSPGLLLQT